MNTQRSSTNIISLEDALFIKADRSWARIQANPAEQREHWRNVGAALARAKGMTKAQREGLLFSEWATARFPEIDVKDEVPAALWYVSEFPTQSEKLIPSGISYPKVSDQPSHLEFLSGA